MVWGLKGQKSSHRVNNTTQYTLFRTTIAFFHISPSPTTTTHPYSVVPVTIFTTSAEGGNVSILFVGCNISLFGTDPDLNPGYFSFFKLSDTAFSRI